MENVIELYDMWIDLKVDKLQNESPQENENEDNITVKKKKYIYICVCGI